MFSDSVLFQTAANHVRFEDHQKEKLKNLYEGEITERTNKKLEHLISLHQRINQKNEELDLSSPKLVDFKERNLNKLKEDIFYYCLPSENLQKFCSVQDEEKDYQFYKDLQCENYMALQKERADIILSNSNLDIIENNKKIKKNFCIDIITHEKIMNNYSLSKIFDEYSYKELKEFDENKALKYFEEIKEIFKLNNLDFKLINIIQANYIEKYLYLLIEIIMDKIHEKKDIIIINKFIDTFFELLIYFQSSQLLFLLIQFLKEHQNNLTNNDSDFEDKINIIPNTCLDFNRIKNININKLIFIDFQQFLENDGIFIDPKNNLKDYWSLNYDNFLFIIIRFPFKMIKNGKEIAEKSKEKFNFSQNENLFIFKIDLIEKKVKQYIKIDIFNPNENKNKEKIIDLNIALKNEFIFISYIIEKDEQYHLKYQIYNINKLILINQNKIALQNSFIPKKLLNDNKYIYCLSNNDKILILKINLIFEKIRYISYSIKLYEENKISNIPNINSFKMYNTLVINNSFILDNIESKKKYLARFFNKNDNFVLKIYKINNYEDNDYESLLRISYNDYKFIITKLNLESFELYFDMTFLNYNNFFHNGIMFLPFNFNNNNYDYSNNKYINLLEQYCYFISIFGNYDMLNEVKNDNLLNLSLIWNFNERNLKYIIKNIIENSNKYDNIKLYYIIILKQIICYFYNNGILDEEKIIDIIPYFKNLIINKPIEQNENIYHNILKEIIIISSYIKSKKIIEVKDLKRNTENQKIFNKTHLLEIELLLTQEITQKDIELYKIIIEIENNNIKNIESLDILNTNSKIIAYYFLAKKIMIKASETLYKVYNSKESNKFDQLIDLIPFLCKNIQNMCNIYIILSESEKSNIIIDIYSFIYNSFSFRIFYFILEKLIINKIFIKTDYILYLYETIIFLDKIKINDIYYELYDMNNIIEIKNSLFKNLDSKGYYKENKNKTIIPIELREPKNIVFEKSVSSYKNLNDLITIKLIKRDNSSYIVNLNYEDCYIFKNVKKIEVEIINQKEITSFKDFIINIIPVKNEKEYYYKMNNNDNKLLSLIQKTIVHYLIFLFDDVFNQIDTFNKDEIINHHCKLYQTEIFKFISISKNIKSFYLESEKEESQILQKTENIKNKIIDIMGEKNIDFNFLNENLMTGLEKINIKSDKNYNKIYEKEINKIDKIIKNAKKDKITITKNINKYDDLLNIFKRQLIKNNSKTIINNNQDKLIKKIFFIAIKYYNCYDKLDILLNKISKIPIENELDKKIQSFKNFDLIYPIYVSCTKIKNIYKENIFNCKESEEKFKSIIEKLDFLEEIIVPSDDENLKPNNSIITTIINLLKNKSIKPFDIEKYSQIQTMNCQIKIIELMIISNLLYFMKSESNINFLLYLICLKMRETKNKGNSFFDKIQGADYYIIERLKYQFHLMLNFIADRINSNQNNFSIATNISLTESLLWKIRGRNFPVLKKILETFKELKKIYNFKDNLFIFEHDNIYNVNYLNEKKKNDTKFNVFKVLVNQIITKIKLIIELESNKENGQKLELFRDYSKINTIDYKDVIKSILSYFEKLTSYNQYYNEFILFFYKIFVNSPNFIGFLLSNYKNVISKIISISFNNEISKDNNLYKNTLLSKLIMLKLFHQILENIDKAEKYYDFMLVLEEEEMEKIAVNKLSPIKEEDYKENKIILTNSTEGNIDKNPFINLCKKLFNKIKNNNENKIINNIFL